MKSTKTVLSIIVLAQFCCTSLWFAGNAIIGNLADVYQLPVGAMGHLTSAVQFGFITGTLLFALLTIADRFSPSKVFFVSAILASGFNLAMMVDGNSMLSLLLLRFGCGFFLAGIYPVGMKIAADYFDKSLGKSLGFLVGALVLGTAFPHLLKGVGENLPWRLILMFTSAIAMVGGLLILLFIKDGPFRKASSKPKMSIVFTVFKKPQFRAAAFGYFGHMWELYAFWAFVPVLLATYTLLHPTAALNIPFWSFIIIAGGGLACVGAGYLAVALGSKKTATLALSLSGICCLLSPVILMTGSEIGLLVFLIFWGIVVVADSPLFSTLVAQNTSPETRGTALTIVNSIGFAITIISIQLLNIMNESINPVYIYLTLSIGPLLGLVALYKPVSTEQAV